LGARLAFSVRAARYVIVGVVVGLLAPPNALAQSPPPCSAEWEARYGPALEIADLGKRIAVGREMEFSFTPSQRADSGFYRPRLGSFVGINSGPKDRQPYFKTFNTDITDDAFFIKPESGELGRTYTAGIGWVEDDLEGSPPCLRTATARTRVVRGFDPRVTVTNEGSFVSFAVAQRRGFDCEQTRPGSVRIIVRGPDRTRAIRLRDTCGKWTNGTGGGGWRLRKEGDFFSGISADFTATALLTPKYRKPGTRLFRYRVTFRRRTVDRGTFESRTRVCNVFGCRG